MNQSRKVTDGALLTAIFVVLMMIAILIPTTMFVVIIVLPVPFIIYAFKHDWQPSLLMLVGAILLSSLLATLFTLPLVILTSVGGVMIGTAMHRNLSAYETWARGTIGFIVGLLFVFLFSQFFLQVNWANEIDLIMEESLEMSKDLVQQFGFGEQVEEELETVEERLLFVKDLIPVGIAIVGIVLAFISQWIGFKVINRLNKKQFRFPPFRNLRIPVAVIWIYFIALVFTFFDLDTDSTLYLAANNVLVLAGIFMLLQGFSFMFFYTHYKKWSKAIPIVGIVITLLLPLYLLHFVRILGIIDIGFGLRAHLSKKKK